jgi:uncharacterized membrane protein
MPDTPKPGVPALGPVSTETFREALRRGARDMRQAPGFALAFAGPYVALGWLMTWITWITGQSYWLVFAVIGFPLVAPFAAVGFYDVSRRIEQGRALDWMQIASVVWRQRSGQLPWLGAVIVVIFLFWFFLAHMIFALFLGLSTMTNVSSSYGIYLTWNGLQMLGFGTLVGAAFSIVLYMISVLSLPMLLDRDIDFVTGMITSFSYVQTHLAPMLGWGVFVAAVTLLSMLPGFFGLLISLPLLGHATWHLYDMLAYGTEAEGEAVAV